MNNLSKFYIVIICVLFHASPVNAEIWDGHEKSLGVAIAAEDKASVVMNTLFDAGYKLGLSADPWEKAPPGLLTSD